MITTGHRYLILLLIVLSSSIAMSHSLENRESIKMNKQERTTLKYYEEQAKTWHKEHTVATGEYYWKEQLAQFKKLLPSGTILDAGCGSGIAAKFLTEAGFDYIGIDISEGMLELARTNNPGKQFKNMSLHSLNFDKKFDGFWACTSLLHLPKKNMGAALQELKKVTKPGGIGFISMKRGTGESVDTKGRFYSYYELEEFSNILAANGFTVTQKSKVSILDREWIVFMVKN